MRATSLPRHLLLFLPCCQAAAFEASFATVTKAPKITDAALYERTSPVTCGYYNGDSASPDVCGAPHICQWSTSTGYPGQMICQTNGYTVTLEPYCVNSGAAYPAECAGTKATLCATCASSLYPYCQTILFASGPGQQVQYSSQHCMANNDSPTIAVYYEPTDSQAAATSTSTSTTSATKTTTTPPPTTTSPSSSSSPNSLTVPDIIGIAISIVTLIVMIVLGVWVDCFRRWLVYLWNCFCPCFEKEVPPRTQPQASSANGSWPHMMQQPNIYNVNTVGSANNNYH